MPFPILPPLPRLLLLLPPALLLPSPPLVRPLLLLLLCSPPLPCRLLLPPLPLLLALPLFVLSPLPLLLSPLLRRCRVRLCDQHLGLPQPLERLIRRRPLALGRRSHMRVLLPDGMDDSELLHALTPYDDVLLEVQQAHKAFCGWDERAAPPGNAAKLAAFDAAADELLQVEGLPRAQLTACTHTRRIFLCDMGDATVTNIAIALSSVEEVLVRSTAIPRDRWLLNRRKRAGRRKSTTDAKRIDEVANQVGFDAFFA